MTASKHEQDRETQAKVDAGEPHVRDVRSVDAAPRVIRTGVRAGHLQLQYDGNPSDRRLKRRVRALRPAAK